MKPVENKIKSSITAIIFVAAFIVEVAGYAPIAMAQSGGRFTVTGNLTTGRTRHTATLLKNGKVLIVGGYGNGLPLVSAELYDPPTRTFKATGKMIAARGSHLAVSLNDGRVLIVGGSGSGGAELYDPSTGAFVPTGSMTEPRAGFSATLLKDGNVLIAGGMEYDPASDNYNYLASAELYDPVTGTFAAIGNMGTGRGDHTATLLNDGRVLIAGGPGQGGLGGAEIYDPPTRTFAVTGSMTAARAGHRATLLQDGTVLIVGPGGRSLVFTSGPSAELYDPTTGMFTSVGDISRSCCEPPTATLLQDGRVLFPGGSKEVCLRFQSNVCTDATSSVTASADLYDPNTRNFSSTGNMIAPRVWNTSTLLLDGTVLVAGGGSQSNPGTPASAEIYMPDPPPFLRAKAFPRATRDFDGDGKADILWRDGAGSVSVGLMNGSAIIRQSFFAVGTGWSIAGSGDFNGDSKADILWRDSAGSVAIWLMNGTTVMSYRAIADVPMAWSIVGVGDFDGDRKSDILWHDASGNVAIWLMDGTRISRYSSIANVWPDWSIAGVGDFDGDRKSDILWRNSSGETAVWLMDGFSIASFGNSGNMTPAAAVAGIGDFNGDGKTDIVCRDNTGNIMIWLMDGSTVISTFITNVWTGWSIVGSGDFNGDGKSDILWQDSTGNGVIWFMNGTIVSSFHEIGV